MHAAIWCVVIVLLLASTPLLSAQDEMVVYQPVDGVLVRDTNAGSMEERIGTLQALRGTWSVIQLELPLLSANPPPIWSPTGHEISVRFVGKYAGSLAIPNDAVTFTTETVENVLNVPFDTTSITGWSADGRSITIDYGPAEMNAQHYLANVDLENYEVQEIRRWREGQQVYDMPLPPDATSVQLSGGYRIMRNPVFDDWFLMRFEGSGLRSTLDNGEPVRANINVLWNFRTDEYISLDSLVPDLTISYREGDWNHDGTRLILQARDQDMRESYFVVLRFNPEIGVVVAERAVVDNRTVQNWLDAGNIFFSIVQGTHGGAAYVLGEIVDGEYRETPFFTLIGDQFEAESFGDWFLRADESEQDHLSCMFDWPLEARLSVGDPAQVMADDGAGLSVYAAPDRFSAEVGLLAENELVLVTGEPACSGGNRWWPIETSDGTTGWAVEADRSAYFLQLPTPG